MYFEKKAMVQMSPEETRQANNFKQLNMMTSKYDNENLRNAFPSLPYNSPRYYPYYHRVKSVY